MKKKGSHVGVMLSFVIFITFLIFLFSILGSPIKLSQNKEAFLDYLDVELNKKFISNLTIVTLTPSFPHAKTCLEFPDAILSLPSDLFIVVKDVNGDIINSEKSVDSLRIKGKEDFLKIYYSEEQFDIFEPVNGNCYLLNRGNVSSVRENEYPYEEKILNFFQEYESNYDSLKLDLNLPDNTEFGLSFVDNSGNIIDQTEEISSTTDIYSREIPIQYFNSTASINSGFINLKVW